MTLDKSIVGSLTAALFVLAGAWTLQDAVVAAETPGKATHVFVKRDAAEKLEPSPNSISRVMLTADQTDGRYSIIDEIFKVGMKSFAHTHAYHSETFLVLDGQMKWTVGGETQIIGPGDLIYIPPDTAHRTEVVGDKDVHAIMIYEPGGYEHGLRRRISASPEQRKDPEYRRRMMELSDVVPLSRQGRDF